MGPLSALLASKVLQSGAQRLQTEAFPAFLRAEAFKGVVYRLNDFVLDPVRLTERLASLGAPHLYTASQIDRIHDGADSARIEIGNLRIACRRLILAAGAGNEALLKRLGPSRGDAAPSPCTRSWCGIRRQAPPSAPSSATA